MLNKQYTVKSDQMVNRISEIGWKFEYLILGLNPTKRKSQKNFRNLDPIFVFWKFLLNFSNFHPIKNSWILFSEILSASCTKKLDPIFLDFSIKIRGFKILKYFQKIFASKIFCW